MASVNLQLVQVQNPERVPFLTPFQFQITFECVAPITADLVRVCAPPTARARARAARPTVTAPPSHTLHPARAGVEGGVRGQRTQQGV